MNISKETREILRNYRAVINARRREMGQKPLTTAQIVDEICDFVANQQAVSSVVTTSFRAAGTGDTGQAVEAACQPARKPLAGWRLPEGMRATLARRPLPFPFVMCPECFFLMLCFCGYCSSSSSSFRSSPVYGFPGRPLAGGLS
ncbi:hypothetical protein ECSTECO31_5214 [Escherichia coli STEC_O31]|nr:hypothetical protein ECSTECO31_5214 [Escherichia coli STEC_O31]